MDRRGFQGPRAAAGSRRATFEPLGMAGKGSKRFSARRQAEAVLRLLRGESLELLSRDLGLRPPGYQAGGTSFSNPDRRPGKNHPRTAGI